MPLAKIDPVETFYSVGSSLIGRILLFFLAGWVGMLIGRVAYTFYNWDDFLDPAGAIGKLWMGELHTELLALILWPVGVLFLSAQSSVLLFFLLAISIAICFYLLVWTEEPAPLWWLVLVAVTSLVPVFCLDEVRAPAVLVLAIFWIGFGILFWWLLRRYHPEVISAMEKVVQGGLDESAPPPTPRRKAPPGTWPKGVKGFEDDDQA